MVAMIANAIVDQMEEEKILHSITTSGRHDMTFNYNLYDYYQ